MFLRSNGMSFLKAPPLRLRASALAALLLSLLLAAAVAVSGGNPTGDNQGWNLQNVARIQGLAPSAPMTFAVFGDTRGGAPVFEKLLQQVDRDPEITFAIHLGDLVKEGGREEYLSFFKQIRQLQKPLLAVVGNHEIQNRGREYYQEFFGPGYYSLQINDAYLLVLDDADIAGPDAAQLRWLTRELEKAQAFKTRLVFLHIPLYDPRGGKNHHCLEEGAARRLRELFQKYRVSHIFAGHIHGYFTGRWQGVPYTITGGAGAQLYGAEPEHFFFHCLKVTVSGSEVRISVERVPAPKSLRLEKKFRRNPIMANAGGEP
jgi:serine/threonine-protein phosphatase CPPED1